MGSDVVPNLGLQVSQADDSAAVNADYMVGQGNCTSSAANTGWRLTDAGELQTPAVGGKPLCVTGGVWNLGMYVGCTPTTR